MLYVFTVIISQCQQKFNRLIQQDVRDLAKEGKRGGAPFLWQNVFDVVRKPQICFDLKSTAPLYFFLLARTLDVTLFSYSPSQSSEPFPPILNFYLRNCNKLYNTFQSSTYQSSRRQTSTSLKSKWHSG